MKKQMAPAAVRTLTGTSQLSTRWTTTWISALALLLLLFISSKLTAQKQALLSEADQVQLAAYEDTLALLSYAIVNDSLPEHRFGACREFILKLKTALKTDNSFQYKFDRIKSASIMYPQDSSFRLITWQLYVDKDEYRYYGAIQMASQELQLFPLIDRSFDLETKGNLEQMTFESGKWYGALYYNMKEFKGPDGNPHYLVFGYDGYEFFNKRKVLDVLHFKNGKPVFGAPVFAFEPSNRPAYTKNRIMMQYSAEVGAKLNYDAAYEQVMLDHLISMPSPHGDIANYPDGSYEGFELKRDGKWHHISKVFHQVQKDPILPDPILDSRTKDIFGKNK
ncbi:MAG: hypothetical protein KTR30_32300 [Saprospiraceae bacterium]|nr:hypothetical protein [Saprospiraceae bacterium]